MWYLALYGVDLNREEWKEANELRGLKELHEGDGSVIQSSKSSDGESLPVSKTLFWRQRKRYLLMSKMWGIKGEGMDSAEVISSSIGYMRILTSLEEVWEKDVGVRKCHIELCQVKIRLEMGSRI